MISKNVLYYGKEADLPEQIELRAGPLSLFYEAGGLRNIRLGERDVLRRIYMALRDRNWGTVPPQLSDLTVEAGEDSFHISYQVSNRHGEVDFTWRGEIHGDAQGQVIFSLDGMARSAFLSNRIGFCVLHPAGLAGAQCRVGHVDGSQENGALPELIAPDQPVQPFAEMGSLAHEVYPGVWAEVRFDGGIFEMEDQRNWTDASFKTFCPPLSLPYPVEVQAGRRIRQSITLSQIDERPPASEKPIKAEAIGRAPILEVISHRESKSNQITLDTSRRESPGSERLRLPPIGLGCASHGSPLTNGELSRLKALHLDHLRVDLELTNPDYSRKLAVAIRDAEALGIPLHIALLVSHQPAETELRQLRGLVDEVRPRVSAWLIYPRQELFQGGSPTRQVVMLAHGVLKDYSPGATFAAGTNTDLIFMQRTPPPLELVDWVTFAINPQVHASDNASLVETLETQGVAVKTARRLASQGPGSRALPVMVSPVTLRPRHNPYATGPEPALQPGDLPPQVDLRQMSLFGAGWTLGSLKFLSESGANSLTYYETTGWRGVMEQEKVDPNESFPSIPGGVFPLYHVLRAVGEFTGGEVIPSTSSNPLCVNLLALRQGEKIRLLCANHTQKKQGVSIEINGGSIWRGRGKPHQVRFLDETNAEVAMRAPQAFRDQAGELIQPMADRLELTLLPYGMAQIDF